MRARSLSKILLHVGVIALTLGSFAMMLGAAASRPVHEATLLVIDHHPAQADHEQHHDSPCPFCRLAAGFILTRVSDLPRLVAFPSRVPWPSLDQATRQDFFDPGHPGARSPPDA